MLWDVRNQRAKWTLRHAAVVGAVAVPASHLLLAASGRQVALWRKDSRVRAFTGVLHLSIHVALARCCCY